VPASIDLETLARAKGLAAPVLRAFGLSDRATGGVRVEYLWPPHGGPARARLRLALGGLDGSRWEEGDAPIGAYWRPLVDELVRRRGVLLLCEGESSCWTAWEAGFGAVGLPGADQVDALRAEHLAGAPAVVVIVEPEDPQTYPMGRERYLSDVAARIHALGYRGRVLTLDLGPVAADLNALWRAEPAAFAERLASLIERSPPLPIPDDDLERAVARTRRFFGCVAPDILPGIDEASWLNVSRFVESTGDEKPALHRCAIRRALPAFDDAGAADVRARGADARLDGGARRRAAPPRRDGPLAAAGVGRPDPARRSPARPRLRHRRRPHRRRGGPPLGAGFARR